MAIAAIWGTTVGYTDYCNGTVVIETVDNRVAVIKKETFEYLYCKLDGFVAALKEDCVHYIIHKHNKCIFEYPEWFVDACADGIVFEDEVNECILNTDSGEIAVCHNSMILRNYKGDLQHLEAYKFHKYYDTLEE